MRLTDLGSVPQAVATLIAAMVALRVSRNWKRQEIGKRRQAVAEEILTTVYQFVSALDDVRRPMVWPSEMVRDGIQLSDDEGIRYAIRKRLMEHHDTFSALDKAIVIAEVHFGRRAAQQIQDFRVFPTSLLFAENLLGGVKPPGYDPDFWLKLQYQSRPPDKLGDRIEAATERVRVILMPHMRMPGETDPDAPPPKEIASLIRFILLGR